MGKRWRGWWGKQHVREQMGAGGQWEPHAKFKLWLQKVQDTGGSSSTASAVLQDMCTSWSRSGNQWGVVMAEQLSQEGHLLRIQHLLRSRVSAHVIQEYGNVGCIIHITSCFWSLLWAQMWHTPWALLPPFSSYPWRDHPSVWLAVPHIPM